MAEAVERTETLTREGLDHSSWSSGETATALETHLRCIHDVVPEAAPFGQHYRAHQTTGWDSHVDPEDRHHWTFNA